MEQNIGKSCIYNGTQHTVIGYAGRNYKLDSGIWAAADQCIFDAEPVADAGTIEAIAYAMSQVDKSRYSRKTKQPGRAAIEEITGFETTDEERDEAWKLAQTLYNL
jgi:hypothetical protein